MNCSKCEILVDVDFEFGGEMDECVVIKREFGKFGGNCNDYVCCLSELVFMVVNFYVFNVLNMF